MDTHVCPWWLAYTFDHRLRIWAHNPERLFGRYVGPGMTVVDIGCGLGFNTLGLAALVGDTGRVIALDIQQKMLDGTRRRAKKLGMDHCIQTHLAQATDLGLDVKAQFILAFYMVHEVHDPDRFMAQVSDNLAANGRFMMIEPPVHVSKRAFEKSISMAETFELVLEARPRVMFGRAAVLKKRV